MFTIFAAVEKYFGSLTENQKTYWKGGIFLTIFVLMISNGIMYSYFQDKMHYQLRAEQENKELKVRLAVLENKYFQTEGLVYKDYDKKQRAISVEYDKKFEKVEDIKAQTAIFNAIKTLMGPNYHSVDEKVVSTISETLYDVSKKYDHDVREMLALLWTENRFNPYRTSDKGARGLGQIMPLWVSGRFAASRQFMEDTGITKVEQLDDVKLNIEGSAWILRHYKNYWIRYGIHDPKEVSRLALLSYNRGEGRVRMILQAGGDPANGYHRRIDRKINILTKTGYFVKQVSLQFQPEQPTKF